MVYWNDSVIELIEYGHLKLTMHNHDNGYLPVAAEELAQFQDNQNSIPTAQ